MVPILIAFDLIFLVVLVHCNMELTLVYVHAEVSDKAAHKAFSLVRKISSILIFQRILNFWYLLADQLCQEVLLFYSNH